jgi:hypothetical protein
MGLSDATRSKWLGRWFLFQTFEDLDAIKDKQVEAKSMRVILEENEDDSNM